jgi:hypothetical protein
MYLNYGCFDKSYTYYSPVYNDTGHYMLVMNIFNFQCDEIYTDAYPKVYSSTPVNGGVIAGVVIGFVCFCILVTGVSCYCRKKRQ